MVVSIRKYRSLNSQITAKGAARRRTLAHDPNLSAKAGSPTSFLNTKNPTTVPITCPERKLKEAFTRDGKAPIREIAKRQKTDDSTISTSPAAPALDEVIRTVFHVCVKAINTNAIPISNPAFFAVLPVVNKNRPVK
jgi:hypothetical protein